MKSSRLIAGGGTLVVGAIAVITIATSAGRGEIIALIDLVVGETAEETPTAAPTPERSECTATAAEHRRSAAQQTARPENFASYERAMVAPHERRLRLGRSR